MNDPTLEQLQEALNSYLNPTQPVDPKAQLITLKNILSSNQQQLIDTFGKTTESREKFRGHLANDILKWQSELQALPPGSDTRELETKIINNKLLIILCNLRDEVYKK